MEIKRMLVADAESARYDVRRMRGKIRWYVADVVRVKYEGRREPMRGYKVGEQVIFENGEVLEEAGESLGRRKRYRRELKRPGEWAIMKEGVEIIVSERGDVVEM
jgi:hypothetical protein